jgi:chromate transporter
MRDNPLIGLIVVLAPFSLVSVGGGPSIFAPLQHQTVDVWRWITAREFIDLFAIARTAPGPGAMLSTLIGWKVAGWFGAFVATVSLFGPASVLCFFVARLYDRYRGRDWHTALEQGLAPIAVGLIFAGALAVLNLSGGRATTWAVAFASGIVLSFRPKLHPFLILFAGALVFVALEFSGVSV